MTDTILLERDGPIATVILNRPERLNALTLAMWERLGEVMTALNGEADIRCIVVRGAEGPGGRKAFGAGADIAEFQEVRADAAQAADYARRMEPALYGLRDSPHPTLAQIEGPCIGGGLEIAMFCDLRIAGQSSRFGIPINRIGHGFALPEVKTLVELVGRATALELLLEGRIMEAPEALQKGLVTRVVADAKVAGEAQAAAKRIAAGAPIAARWHKKATRRVLDSTPLGEVEIAEGHAICDTADYREGVRAFVAKERPEFSGE